MEMIRICKNHQGYKVPLIYTFAFNKSEFWCPYCGFNGGFFGSGKQVESTARLRNRYRRFKKASKDFLEARSIKICSSTMWEGKRISPKDLPQEEKDRIEKVIGSYRYKTKL